METLQELLYKYPAYKEAEGLFGKKGKHVISGLEALKSRSFTARL